MSEQTTKQPSLFDFLSDLTFAKKYIYVPGDSNKNYTAFMINRGLAQNLDTILLANEMNKRPGLSEQMHHDYLFYSIDAKKRYGKWAKADKTDQELLDYLKGRYSINQSVAIDYLNLMDRTELEELKKESQRKGGR